jgi:hypothetical protein
MVLSYFAAMKTSGGVWLTSSFGQPKLTAGLTAEQAFWTIFRNYWRRRPNMRKNVQLAPAIRAAHGIAGTTIA